MVGNYGGGGGGGAGGGFFYTTTTAATTALTGTYYVSGYNPPPPPPKPAPEDELAWLRRRVDEITRSGRRMNSSVMASGHQLATSDRERASRLRSAPVAISRGPDPGRSYFDGGCSMPATSAVEPVLPVEGAAPVSAVEHVRPSTGRADLSMADTVAAIVGWAA